MNSIEVVDLDISVVLGRARMPIHQLLKMGRGAIITLDASENDEVEILANDHPVAKGVVVVNGSAIGVEISTLIKRVGAVTASDQIVPVKLF